MMTNKKTNEDIDVLFSLSLSQKIMTVSHNWLLCQNKSYFTLNIFYCSKGQKEKTVV